MVRITKIELSSFKNVSHGVIDFPNLSSAEKDASLENMDILGITGPNGSGKTALVEAMSLLQYVLSGSTIPYEDYANLISPEGTKIITDFLMIIEKGKFKVLYELFLSNNSDKSQIRIESEKISYWVWDGSWKNERCITISNPFYNEDCISNETVHLQVDSEMNIFDSNRFWDDLGVFCSQQNVSLFFNDMLAKNIVTSELENKHVLSTILFNMLAFGRFQFFIVKSGFPILSSYNWIDPLPASENETVSGMISLFLKGEGEISEENLNQFREIAESINIAVKAMIPNYSVDLTLGNKQMDNNGNVWIRFKVFADCNGKRYPICHESDGNKRILGLLYYLVLVYKDPGYCVAIDDFDAGIFEFLFDELLRETLKGWMKGQILFTSNIFSFMRNLDSENIMATTTNPENKYIHLTKEKEEYIHDVYYRALLLDGQEEELFNDGNLKPIGRTFWKAGRIKK